MKMKTKNTLNDTFNDRTLYANISTSSSHTSGKIINNKFFYLSILFILTGISSVYANYTINKFPNPNICATYPSATTGSSAPSTDIVNAKLYYTGTTNIFSAGTLFGSFNNPNRTFIINVSQALSLGVGT